jgi:hypothetical protein
MTNRLLLLLLPALLLVAAAGPLRGRAEAAPEDLPPGVVALVGGKQLTFDGFCIAAVQQALPEIKRTRSGPRGKLEELIEELMVSLECKRLGIVVTEKDVQQQWDEWDKRLRINSNGERTLRQMVKEQSTSEKAFRIQIAHLVRKERIASHPENLGKLLPKNETARLAQIGIVIKQLRDRTKVQYGIETVDHLNQGTKPDVLPAGIVATVDGHPITEEEFGRALVLRLSGDEVRDYLDKECKTAIMSMEGIRITDAEFDDEVEHLRKEWELWRELQREELWSTVSFKDRFQADFKGNIEDVRTSRYSRGLIGLVRRMRPQVKEEEVREEYTEQRNTRFGAHILVNDIMIRFAQESGLLAVGRKREEALRMANDLVRRQEAGESFEKIANSVNARKDRTFQAKKIRLYKSDEREADAEGNRFKGRLLNKDSVLYEQAARLRDGDITSPFETLSEVHVIKREGVRPARTLDEVRSYIVDQIARREAREWINERVKDPKYVQLKWPLPERGD